MNREFAFTMRDVVNWLFVYIPAGLCWLAVIYGLTHREKGKKP